MNKSQLTGRRIWVLRPRSLEQQLCYRINLLGGTAVAVPMLRIVHLPHDESVFSGHSGIIFTSRNAVRAVAEHSAVLQRARVYAVGDGTAAELRQIGCTKVTSAGTRGGAESLLAHQNLSAAKIQGHSWLVVCGIVSRNILPDTLHQRGAAVTLARVYQSIAVEPEPGYMEGLWAAPPHIVVAYSTGELQQLLRITPDSSKMNLMETPVAVLSSRIATAAKLAGFAGRVVVADNTDDEACLEAICKLASMQQPKAGVS